MKNNQGYVLVEILIAVQIVLVVILFIVSVAMFNRMAIYENEQKQSAMYILQTEIEKFIAEQVKSSLWLGNVVDYVHYVDIIADDVHHNLEIKATWNRVSDNLANISGQAIWFDGKRTKTITLITNQFIYTPKEEEMIDE